jgi:hypothetical protein
MSLVDPCCGDGGITRRDFLTTTLAGATAIGAGALVPPAFSQTPRAASETLVTTLYKSLTDSQRRVICFPFEHPLRSKVDNNWHITSQTVAGFFTKDQQQMIREIFLGLHSPEYAERVWKQVEHDSGRDGFFGGSSIGIFGQPGTGAFEFVLTGRHCTRRCDGDSVAGTAFGGPIFYGHAAESFNERPDHRGNAYWYQAIRANEVFKALNGKQRELALVSTYRREQGNDTVKLTGRKNGLPGVPMTELTRDQRDLVHKVLADLLAPFRQADAAEAMKLVEAAGIDNLHLAFYKNEDLGNDGVWDVWQVEGPAMVWYFRGRPHVHVWAQIKAPTSI